METDPVDFVLCQLFSLESMSIITELVWWVEFVRGEGDRIRIKLDGHLNWKIIKTSQLYRHKSS